jgi:hypothetical protein
VRLSKLTQELALALEVASIAQAWGNPSPFQDKINELLVKAGRKPVAPDKACVGRIELVRVFDESEVEEISLGEYAVKSSRRKASH